MFIKKDNLKNEKIYEMSESNESKSKISPEEFINAVKGLDLNDLFKIQKAAMTEIEKRSKQKEPKAVKKSGSMPKGEQPPQLRMNCEWVSYTLQDALANGWESFTVSRKKMVDGVKTVEDIEMAESVVHEGSHIYKDSISEKDPNGRQLIHKDAMSLSKHRKESGHPTYEAFMENYTLDKSDSEKEEPIKVDKVDDKVDDKEAKKIEKAKELAEKKLAKEKEQTEKKLAKEKEQTEKKLAKEKEQTEKKLAKEQAGKKKPVIAK